MKKTVLALLAICFILLSAPFSVYAASNVPQQILDLRPGVVRVVCDMGDMTSNGTGFAVGTQEPVGYIATNYHVVEGNPNNVAVHYGEDSYINAEVVAERPASDICILKLDKPIYGIKPLLLNDRNDAQTGDSIYTLGFPGSADEFSDADEAKPEDVTVTDGIISGVKSSAVLPGRTPVQLYQINAALNQGNSGGPLVNEHAQVIGINTFGIEGAQNTNAAVSVLELTSLLKQSGIPYRTSNIFLDNILIFIAAGGAVTAGLVIRTLRRRKRNVRSSVRKRSKSVPLESYLDGMGGKVPFEMALHLLEPVIRGLAGMHEKGMCHLDICPERIVVDKKAQMAILMEPGKKDESGYTILMRPGYSPPEQYKANGDIGTWTDVYSVGAVLYRMVTGKNPPDAMSRVEEDTELSGNIDEHTIEPRKKQVWLDSLRLPVENRIKACGILAKEWLGDRAENEEEQNAENVTAQAAYEEAQEKVKKVPKQKKKRKLRPLYVLGALGIAIGCYFGWVEYHYQKAVEYAGAQYFDQAVEEIFYVPVFYKDSTDLNLYAYAGQDMKQGNFGVAKAAFEDLGDYRDAKEMVKEADYEEAFSLLDSENYKQAKRAFEKLGDYKDSETMITETDYRNAIDLLNEEKYLDAYKLLDNIQGYSDVNDILYTLEDVIYWEGVDLYEAGKKISSKGYFEAIEGYSDSNYYIQLINAQFQSGEKGYQALLELIGFEDAIEIIMTDEFIYNYLEGYWSDGYGYYFELQEESRGSYTAPHNLPSYDTKYFTIDNGIFKLGDDRVNWTNALRFTFVSPNEMTVYCYKNNRMYEMYRQ